MLEFTEEGGISIYRVDASHTFTIYIESYWGINNKCNGRWEVQIKDLKDYYIRYQWESNIDILDSHPLLLEYQENNMSLYYSNRASNPDKLFSDIYVYNTRLLNQIRPNNLNKYINNGDLFGVCNNSSGLFARGPETIISEYQRILNENNVSNNILSSDDSDIFVSENATILILGDSYIIAKDFTFNKVN